MEFGWQEDQEWTTSSGSGGGARRQRHSSVEGAMGAGNMVGRDDTEGGYLQWTIPLLGNEDLFGSPLDTFLDGTDTDGTGSDLGSTSSNERWPHSDSNETMWVHSDSDETTASTQLSASYGNEPASIDLNEVVQATATFDATASDATASQRNVPVVQLLNGVRLTRALHAQGSRPVRWEKTAEAPYCPFCLSRAIVPGQTEGIGADLLKSKPRQYMPRYGSRKENRLAAWYSKYGYTGPIYCKACSEAFSSHLLKQATRSTKSSCDRHSPCSSCRSILAHFECSPDELYAKSDAARSVWARGASQKGKRKQLKQSVGVVGIKQNPSKKLRRAGAAVAVIAAVALCVGYNHGGSSSKSLPTTADLPARREDAWICPVAVPASDISPQVPGSFEVGRPVYWPDSCDGEQSAHTFTCSVDECKKPGAFSVGHRLCRCDGCVHSGGLCGEWTLLGQRSQPSSDRATVCEGGTDAYAWPHPAVTYSTEITDFTDEEGGHHGVIMWTGPLYPHSSSVGASERVWMLSFSNATAATDDAGTGTWTWASTYISDKGTYVDEPNDFEDGSSDALHVGNKTAARTSSPAKQVHKTTATVWYFEPETNLWKRSATTSGYSPDYHSSSAWWSDSTGALFLFSGFSSSGDTSAPMPDVHYSHTTANGDLQENLPDLWQLDPVAQTWTKLPCCTDGSSIAGGRYSAKQASQVWPSPRVGHSMWNEYHDVTSTSTEQQEFVVWMFGGVRFGVDAARSRRIVSSIDAATQLWRGSYHYSQYSGGIPSGLQWLLVTAQARPALSTQEANQLPSSPGPIYSCQDRDISGESRLCPAGRVEAGSWQAQGRQGGWVFGGYNLIDLGHQPPEYLINRRMSDLWYFNGNTDSPRWKQYLARVDESRPSGLALWPPGWSSAIGWETSVAAIGNSRVEPDHNMKVAGAKVAAAEDEAEEKEEEIAELWLVGGSGQQGVDSPIEGEDLAKTSTTWMWRFDIMSGTWEAMQPRNDDARAWPAPRARAAAVALGGGHQGMLFGGTGLLVCEPESIATADDLGHKASEDTLRIGPLSSLWRWDVH